MDENQQKGIGSIIRTWVYSCTWPIRGPKHPMTHQAILARKPDQNFNCSYFFPPQHHKILPNSRSLLPPACHCASPARTLTASILPVHAYYVQAETLRPCCSLYGVKDERDKPLKHQMESRGVRAPTARWCFPTDTSRHSLPNLLLQPGKSCAMEAQPGSVCLPGAADFVTRLWHGAHDVQRKTTANR